MTAMGDTIAVPQLHRMWSRARAGRAEGPAVDPVEAAADRIAIYGLGLGLHETLLFLHGGGGGFDDFQAWVAARAGGTIDAARIDLVNDRIRRLGNAGAEGPTAPVAAEPALDADDLAGWEEQGYVVLRRAVSRDAALAAEQAVWDFIGARPDDPGTWYGDRNRDGIWVPLIHHPALEANRRSPRIHAAYAQLLGTDDLVVTVDQAGFNPPERADWPFTAQGLHWDTSLAQPIPLGIQGILYLSDTPAHQGAFRCVPGFHRRIGAWLDGLPTGVKPRDAILNHPAVGIAGRAGDMVLWRDALPHGASPNRGDYPRVAQYVTMYRADSVERRPWL